MRDRLVYAYFEVERDVVWRKVEEDLPPLASMLKDALKDRGA